MPWLNGGQLELAAGKPLSTGEDIISRQVAIQCRAYISFLPDLGLSRQISNVELSMTEPAEQTTMSGRSGEFRK